MILLKKNGLLPMLRFERCYYFETKPEIANEVCPFLGKKKLIWVGRTDLACKGSILIH